MKDNQLHNQFLETNSATDLDTAEYRRLQRLMTDDLEREARYLSLVVKAVARKQREEGTPNPQRLCLDQKKGYARAGNIVFGILDSKGNLIPDDEDILPRVESGEKLYPLKYNLEPITMTVKVEGESQDGVMEVKRVSHLSDLESEVMRRKSAAEPTTLAAVVAAIPKGDSLIFGYVLDGELLTDEFDLATVNLSELQVLEFDPNLN
ncbi:hypothetical protein KBC79_01200 [Candidatus Woesebacteria bacterium]|nr:hypothetical protein [Candidatus Woesebacteria bacterium]